MPDAFLADLAMSLNNVGIRLSDLGRREEALTATEEAVRILRQLASQRPDAFLADLARSLGAEGAVLREMGNGGEAVAAFQEGIEILRPFFIRLPGAFRPLMTFLVAAYRGACETSGIEADLELLGAICRCCRTIELTRRGLERLVAWGPLKARPAP